MTPREDAPPTIAPEVCELRPAPTPVDVFRALSGLPHCLFLDSAQRHPTLGRYSYVTADPFAYRQLTHSIPDPLGELANGAGAADGNHRPGAARVSRRGGGTVCLRPGPFPGGIAVAALR